MKQKSGQVRIIGGRYRSRRLRFPAVRDLRPSPDAVRETLFNWLMPFIEGSTCLDLFAGSGALGFEALSRGARRVTLVESNRVAARQLIENADVLDAASSCHVINGSASHFLEHCPDQFDIVFLDPPYNSELLAESVNLLADRKLFSANALLYIETSIKAVPLPIPSPWHTIHTTDCGVVRAFLIEVVIDQSGRATRPG